MATPGNANANAAVVGGAGQVSTAPAARPIPYVLMLDVLAPHIMAIASAPAPCAIVVAPHGAWTSEGNSCSTLDRHERSGGNHDLIEVWVLMEKDWTSMTSRVQTSQKTACSATATPVARCPPELALRAPGHG